MPLSEIEFSPGDDLWDLVTEAAARAQERLAAPAGWVFVFSQGEAGYAAEECASVDAGRERAHALLAGAWRAAVVWREGERVLIEAQDAEDDSLAGRFAVPIEPGRRRLLRGAEPPTLGEPEFPDPVPPLRAPTWNGTTWTLRAGERVVAELRVTETIVPYLWADVTPLDGLETVLPESPYRQTPVGEWALHQPDGTRVEADPLQLNREQANWTWKGAFGL